MADLFANVVYFAELCALLKASTLTPGEYAPTDKARSGKHVAVLVGSSPVVLCGPHDHAPSVAQAAALAASEFGIAAFRVAGHEGAVRVGVVSGADIDWTDNMTAIVQKESGSLDDETPNRPLIAIVLQDPKKTLATALCICTETARALDPEAPELGSAARFIELARRAD